MARRIWFLTLFSLLGCSPAPSTDPADSPGIESISRVVEKLEKISLERRTALVENAGQKSPSVLNATIPEIDAIEVDNTKATGDPKDKLRILSWNAQRGGTWSDAAMLIQEHPDLRNPDVLLLQEMDLGMVRSANEHTTAKLATALGMNYAYGVEFLELTKGDPLERAHYSGENEFGYHGNAILSRYPLRDARMIRFRGIEKWFGSFQNRLGGRMALLATIEVQNKEIVLISTHFESSRPEETRTDHMRTLLALLSTYSKKDPVILGGDLNATVEERVFWLLEVAGFSYKECNDLEVPTRQSKKEGGVVLDGDHVDYICIRDLKVAASRPKVVPAVYPLNTNGEPLSDHAFVRLDVQFR